jgi:hypothetical protein
MLLAGAVDRGARGGWRRDSVAGRRINARSVAMTEGSALAAQIASAIRGEDRDAAMVHEPASNSMGHVLHIDKGSSWPEVAIYFDLVGATARVIVDSLFTFDQLPSRALGDGFRSSPAANGLREGRASAPIVTVTRSPARRQGRQPLASAFRLELSVWPRPCRYAFGSDRRFRVRETSSCTQGLLGGTAGALSWAARSVPCVRAVSFGAHTACIVPIDAVAARRNS